MSKSTIPDRSRYTKPSMLGLYEQIQSKKNQDRKIAQTEQLINKFRAKANKASFAQSLIKQLDKVERIEVDEEDTRSMRFYFPSAPRAGEVVLKGQELSKNYGNLNLRMDLIAYSDGKKNLIEISRIIKQPLNKIARNLVDYEVGKTIFETAIGIIKKQNVNQTELF